jgi:hypothetical protein
MVLVMTEVFLPTGQLVTVGAHEVMVYSTVERMVEVDIGAHVVDGAEVSVSVTGQTVVYKLMISVVT